MKSLSVFLVTASLAAAQSIPISAGVRAGVPFRPVFPDRNLAPFRLDTLTNPYILGPMVEFGLPRNLLLEFNALFRNTNLDLTTPGLFLRGKVAAWEFPTLLKYRVPLGRVRPYGGLGVNFRHLGHLNLQGGASSGAGTWARRGNVGVAAGGGVTISVAGRVKLSPELRYTRWGLVNALQTYPAVTRQDKNQLDLLVGLHF